MRCVFLAASSPKQNLLSHFENWYVFVRRPTRARDFVVDFLPSWLDTLVSIREAMTQGIPVLINTVLPIVMRLPYIVGNVR